MTKKLNHKHFRYLTKEEFKNPLYAVAEFCRNYTDLQGWKSDIDRMIKVGCSTPKGLKARDFASLYYNWRQVVKHIELLYLLKNQIADWSVSSDSSLYDATFYHRMVIIYDATLYNGTYLEFKRLKPKEVRNFKKVLEKLFNFMSLREWQHAMDEWLSTFFENDNLEMFTAYTGKATRIYNYIEKIGEAIFLAYILKAKEHIFKHHVKDFYLERYLNQEETETSEDDLEKDENPEATAPPDSEESSDASESTSPDETTDEDE